MQDLSYFNEEGRYLNQAWDVYRDYFTSQSSFLSCYKEISSRERKNRFLMVLFRYRLLVRDGEYRLIGAGTRQHLYISYLDQTYKFISIMSLIEALFAEEKYVDFFQWLTMKKRKKQIFPITDEKALDDLYRQYKLEYGARRAVRFFSELDEGGTRPHRQHSQAGRGVAQKLYIMRSEFVHQARPVLEFNDGQVFSKLHGKVMYSILSFQDLQLLFEHGLLNHFCMLPDYRKI